MHARNRIEVLRPIRTGEALDLEVWAERFATHRSGATVDLCATASVGGSEVWRSRSTYLARGAQAPDGAPEADVEVAVGDLERVAATWRIPDDAGRRYATVSGDVNPIHLSGLTAKAFGFKRAIAHGMWVKARVLGALVGPAAGRAERGCRLPEAAVPAVDRDAVDGAGRRGMGRRRPQRGQRHRARGRRDPPALSGRTCTA